MKCSIPCSMQIWKVRRNDYIQYARCPQCNAIIDVDNVNLRPTLNCPACQKRTDGKDLIVIDNKDGKEFSPGRFSPKPKYVQAPVQQLNNLRALSLPAHTHWYNPPSPTHGTLLFGKLANWLLFCTQLMRTTLSSHHCYFSLNEGEWIHLINYDRHNRIHYCICF